MDKKGQGDPIKAIIGIFTLIVTGIIVVIIISSVSNSITQDQCKPIQEQLGQCQLQINSYLVAINQTTNLLEECKNNYSELANNSITKKDFEEVKGYFNLTQNEITTLNNKIDGINRVYNFYTIKNYSFALNIVLGIEVLSFLILKNEFIIGIINWIKRSRKKKENKLEIKEDDR